jgi:hypothetical protein
MPLIIPGMVLRQMKAMPKADQARIIEALEQVAADLTVRMPFVTDMIGEPGIWRPRKSDSREIFVIEGADVVSSSQTLADRTVPADVVDRGRGASRHSLPLSGRYSPRTALHKPRTR